MQLLSFVRIIGEKSVDSFNIICNLFASKSIEETICVCHNRFAVRYDQAVSYRANIADQKLIVCCADSFIDC